MSLTIREIRSTDYDQWVALWTAYLAFYGTDIPLEDKKTAFDRLLDHEQNVHGFVAERDGRLIGLVHYIFHEHMWRPEGICYLQDLFADPNVRGIGIGRALIEAVYAAADNVGVPRVYWLTQDHNEGARRLYDNIGKLTPFIRYDRP